MFTSKGRCVQDVRRRIGIAKSAFTSLEKVLKSRNIKLQLRIRVLKCYVWSTLLYGSETWTLTSDLMMVTGFIEGRRTRDRQRDIYLTYMQKMKGMTPIELIHLA